MLNLYLYYILILLFFFCDNTILSTDQNVGFLSERRKQTSVSIVTCTLSESDSNYLPKPLTPLSLEDDDSISDHDESAESQQIMRKVNLNPTDESLRSVFYRSRHESFNPLDRLLSASQVLQRYTPHAPHQSKNGRTIWILSVDGGGIRGIIPAIILTEIEKQVKKPIHLIFDVMVGTSTGGIIVQALNTPAVDSDGNTVAKYTAQDLRDLYVNHGDQIFGSRFKNKFSANGMLRPKYSSKGLKEMTHNLFGDTRLSDSLGNVVLTGFEIGRYREILFSSCLAQSDEGENFFMRDVAIATSSAPTYFKPMQLRDMAGNLYTVIDGGVIANNPAMIGLTMAEQMFPHAKEFKVLSIGTGQVIKTVSYRKMKRKGGIGWINPLVDIIMSGSSSLVHREMQIVLPDILVARGIYERRYFRLQPIISREFCEMNDISQEHIESLIYAAERVISSSESDLASIITSLAEKNSPALLSIPALQSSKALVVAKSTPSLHR